MLSCVIDQIIGWVVPLISFAEATEYLLSRKKEEIKTGRETFYCPFPL